MGGSDGEEPCHVAHMVLIQGAQNTYEPNVTGEGVDKDGFPGKF